MTMIIPNLTELVSEEHPYRKMQKLINFERLCEPLKDCYSNIGRGGYPVSQGFCCLLLQFMDDLSDRQLELALQDSLASKLFCGFSLTEETPDHSYFGHLRNRIGTKRLAELFDRVVEAFAAQCACGPFYLLTGISRNRSHWNGCFAGWDGQHEFRSPLAWRNWP